MHASVHLWNSENIHPTSSISKLDERCITATHRTVLRLSWLGSRRWHRWHWVSPWHRWQWWHRHGRHDRGRLRLWRLDKSFRFGSLSIFRVTKKTSQDLPWSESRSITCKSLCMQRFASFEQFYDDLCDEVNLLFCCHLSFFLSWRFLVNLRQRECLMDPYGNQQLPMVIRKRVYACIYIYIYCIFFLKEILEQGWRKKLSANRYIGYGHHVEVLGKSNCKWLSFARSPPWPGFRYSQIWTQTQWYLMHKILTAELIKKIK